MLGMMSYFFFRWAKSKKSGWPNILILGKYKKIEIFFLTWNNFFIAGTTYCFNIKNYSIMCDSLTVSHTCDS